MALVTTIAEIKAVLPNMSNLSQNANIPNMDKAAWKYIIPLLGKPFYDDLQTKYTGSSLSAGELILLKHIQLPLVAYAYLDNSGLLHATITDSGVRRTSTSDMPTVYKWEFDELMNTIRTAALDGVEMLLDYLFANKVSYALWTAGPAYSIISNRIIKTGKEFSEQYVLFHPYRTFWKLLPIMKDAEELYMTAPIGRDLLNWVRSQDAIVVDDNGANVDVKEFFKKAAAFFTIYMATRHLPVRFNEEGFTVATPAGTENPEYVGRTNANALQVENKGKEAKREGENYLAKAVEYLQRIYAGEFAGVFTGFTAAYNNGPLAAAATAEPYDNGNSRRKIFRF